MMDVGHTFRKKKENVKMILGFAGISKIKDNFSGKKKE